MFKQDNQTITHIRSGKDIISATSEANLASYLSPVSITHYNRPHINDSALVEASKENFVMQPER
jgi:hypothetical protein